MENLLRIINTVLKNRGKAVINLIEGTTNLRDDIGFDSLDLAELTVRIEAEYGVDIFADGLISTVSEIIQKIKK